jgi:hypothetical protein
LNSSKKYPPVGTAPKNTTLLEQLREYHTVGTAPTNTTVGTAPKYTTLFEQLQNIPHCWNSSKIYHCWNSSKKYHTVGTAPKYTTLLEQLQNIPHCWNSSKIYHTVGTVPKSNFKIIERGKTDTPNTRMYIRSLSWIGTVTLINSGGAKLVIWAKSSPLSEMMLSIKCFPDFNKRKHATQTFIYGMYLISLSVIFT